MWWTDKMDWGLIKSTCLRQMKFRGVQRVLYGAILSFLLFCFCFSEIPVSGGVLLSIVIGFCAVFLVQCFFIIRFFRMIRKQEKQFEISFSDCDAKPLWKGASVYTTNDWCILGGTAAFYRGYIKNVTWQYERRYRGTGSYYLIVNTLDGQRFRIWLGKKSSCSRIKSWWKTVTGGKDYGL